MTKDTRGNTELLIDELCQAVADGQPRSIVISHNTNYWVSTLRPRIARVLTERHGLEVVPLGDDGLFVDGSIIEFASAQTALHKIRSRRGYGVFIDHAVSMFSKEIEQVLAQEARIG